MGTKKLCSRFFCPHFSAYCDVSGLRWEGDVGGDQREVSKKPLLRFQSYRSHFFIPKGYQDISRWLSGATPPETIGEGASILNGSTNLRTFQGRSRIVEYPGVPRIAASPRLLSCYPVGMEFVRTSTIFAERCLFDTDANNSIPNTKRV